MARDLLAGNAQPRDLLAGTQPQEQQDGLLENGLDVLGELAAGANRSVTEFVDFLGPDTANAILSLAGSKTRVPTLTGALESTGIQGGFMDEGMARDAVRAAGNTATAAAGMAQVPRNLAKAPGIVAEALGIGSAKAPVAIGAQTATELALKRNTGDIDTAKVMLDKAGKVIKDGQAAETVKQGFDEGFVAMMKSAPAQSRQKMLAMLDIVEQGKKNFRYKSTNRPLDVTGKSVNDRVKVVWQANRMAARALDNVANGLKGNAVDTRPAVDSFLQELDSMGIAFDPKKGALSFDGSDIEGLKGPQKVIGNIVNRMRNTRNPDAYDVHRLKKFIDHQVSYGKSKKGLDGKVEGILKQLRHNLDGTLDSAFPEYNRVNTQYAETRGAIDALQDVAGQKMDLMGENADKALGTLTRRILSNAQSRVPLMDSLSQLDDTARKYGAPRKFAKMSGRTDIVPFDDIVRPIVPHGSVLKRAGVDPATFDDDLIAQVEFASQLDGVFGTHAGNSFQGEITKAVDRAAINTAAGRDSGLVEEAATWAVNKARGINEDNALKAMRELLERDL